MLAPVEVLPVGGIGARWCLTNGATTRTRRIFLVFGFLDYGVAGNDAFTIRYVRPDPFDVLVFVQLHADNCGVLGVALGLRRCVHRSPPASEPALRRLFSAHPDLREVVASTACVFRDFALTRRALTPATSLLATRPSSSPTLRCSRMSAVITRESLRAPSRNRGRSSTRTIAPRISASDASLERRSPAPRATTRAASSP
jgi:hypothetical protein